jgi:hypothetical protein
MAEGMNEAEAEGMSEAERADQGGWWMTGVCLCAVCFRSFLSSPSLHTSTTKPSRPPRSGGRCRRPQLPRPQHEPSPEAGDVGGVPHHLGPSRVEPGQDCIGGGLTLEDLQWKRHENHFTHTHTHTHTSTHTNTISLPASAPACLAGSGPAPRPLPDTPPPSASAPEPSAGAWRRAGPSQRTGRAGRGRTACHVMGE